MKSLIFLFIILETAPCLAFTLTEREAVSCILGEARGEGLIGMTAVGEAMRNRGTIKGVYGCGYVPKPTDPIKEAKQAWEDSEYTNITNGATMWENIIAFGKPSWYNCVVETITIKNHTFFKEKESCQK